MRQNLASLAATFILALILTACESPTDKQTAGELVSVVSQVPMTIGRLICGGHLPLAIVEKKFTRLLGSLRLHTLQKNDWNEMAAAMQNGRLDGAFMLSPLALDLIKKGLAAKIVLIADRNGNGFVLSRKIASIDALRNSAAIIAVPHLLSQHHVLLEMALQQHHIPLRDISIISMPPREMINSLRRGEIDGFVVGEPEAHKSTVLGVGWMAAISPDIWKGHMDHVLLVSDRFIAAHPRGLQQLVTALVRAGSFIESHPHEAALLAEDYTGSMASVFETVLTTPPDWIAYNNMLPSVEDIQSMMQQLVAMGYWKKLPDDSALYIEPRFVKSAMATRQQQ